MPSPFPGMDPFVEQSDLFPELHGPLMTYARDELQPGLPEGYVARLELRIYTEREGNGGPSLVRLPDLELIRLGAGRASGGLAVAEHEEEHFGTWIEAPLVERREAAIAIRTLPEQELVTWVELLSPNNKRPGVGRDEYLRKQSEALGANVNLAEIDLLRGGLPTVAALTVPHQLPPFHYLVSIYRGARPWGFLAGYWTVREPIPRIPIPLAAPDPDLRLDLQALFARAYDNAAFPKLIDYTAEPDPPLAAEDAAWADALLRETGCRGA